MDLYTTPVMPAPPGEVTNFHPGVTAVQHKFIIVYVGTLAAATLTLALRLWTRAVIIREFWLDDYAVIGAWLMNIGFLVCCIEWMKYGFGDHLWNVSLAQLTKYAQWATPVVTTYCWAPMLTKFSILILYLRLSPGRVLRYFVFFLMFMIFSYTIATTLIVATGCKPTDPSKIQCINDLALAQAILNISSDFFVIIIPLPMIYKLQMPNRQKLALSVLLTAGSFVVIASIIRLVIIQALPGQTDTTWVEAEVCVWSAIELNVGLMCNCLVVIKPLVQRYAGTLLSFRTRSKPSGYINRQTGPKIRTGNELDSLPLTGVDGRCIERPSTKTVKDEILITTTYTIGDEEVGAEHNGLGSRSGVMNGIGGGNRLGLEDKMMMVVSEANRVGRGQRNSLREFDTSSQEELAKRVRAFIS